MVVLVIRAEEEDATRKENLRLRPYKRQQQRSEKMRFYHAAPKETMMKIYAEGVLKKSWDGVVYMCKDPIDACKFLVIRGMRQMSVIELELDEKEVEESHDHSETFFKCKAYIKHGDIVLSGDERIFDYDFEQRKRTSVASRCPVQVVSDLKFTRNIIANLTQKSNLKRDRKGL